MAAPWLNANCWLPIGILIGSALACQQGCGKYPTPLRTANDIARTSAETEMLSVRELPLEHFPALAKFTKLKQLKFYNPSGTGASDEKLQVVAQLNFPN